MPCQQRSPQAELRFVLGCTFLAGHHCILGCAAAGPSMPMWAGVVHLPQLAWSNCSTLMPLLAMHSLRIWLPPAVVPATRINLALFEHLYVPLCSRTLGRTSFVTSERGSQRLCPASEPCLTSIPGEHS